MTNIVQIPKPPKNDIKWPFPWITPLQNPLPRKSNDSRRHRFQMDIYRCKLFSSLLLAVFTVQ